MDTVSFCSVYFSPLTDSPTDFMAMPNTPLLFQPNQRRVCVNIPIEDDDMVEQTESFTIILRGTQDLHESIRLTQTNGYVVIIDDDGRLKNGHISCIA